MAKLKDTDLSTMRHSTAHLLAAALTELYPGIKLGIGPAIEHGFYYDVQSPQPLSTDDFAVIEAKMNEIKERHESYVREDIPLQQALDLFTQLGQPYKVDILTSLREHAGDTQETELEQTEKGERVSIYRTGSFVDLCRGPHVDSTADIGAYKLKSIAGAYWRGDESQAMLQRIYGVAFQTHKEVDDYFSMLEEAAARDHRKLGKELGLFAIIDDIGAGLPLFYPRGALLRRFVEQFITEEQEKRGYVPIWIPHITKEALYKTSGHLDKYDAMYPPMHLDEDRYYLKPMNCPHFMMLYNTQPHSYRDLPLRYTCTTTNYRHEKSGELSGLTRVRALTQDDCHVFCTHEQIEAEISRMLDMIGDVYRVFGFEDYTVSISVRDPQHPEQYIGSQQHWENAEMTLKKVVAQKGMKSSVVEGEAAFYGPKLDFLFKDALMRTWQLSTIQLDYNLPERFDCSYVGNDGAPQRPVVIHRAILGSTERFLGIMIEHFAGKFPLWLSPQHATLLPVGLAHHEHCSRLKQRFDEAGLRVQIDDANESVGYKIRRCESEKIPFMIVIGDKEVESGCLSVRVRGVRESKETNVDHFISTVSTHIAARTLELPQF